MNFENILYEIEDGILYLTLNRPEARNALTPAMWKDIRTAVEMARIDDSVQVVIVSGAGDKALASGADIQEIHDRDYLKMLPGTSSVALKELEDLYKPVICDIRIATARSRFGHPETWLSIIPGAGGTQRLSRLIGVGKAKELIYTGRTLTAEEAKEMGLVNQVTENTREELMAAALKMAHLIMKKGPVAVSMAKMAINVGMDTDINTGLLFERIAQTVAFSTEDRREGTAAFLEKREAVFKGK